MAQQHHGAPQHWRPQGTDMDAAGDSRLVRRWISTLFVLFLIGALIYVILQLRGPRTLVAVLPITDYTSDVPLNPIDSTPFEQLPEAVSSITYKDWTRFQRSDSGGIENEIAQQLIDWSQRKRDAIVVFATAHGVSRNGKPFLLYNDFVLGDGDWERQSTVVPATTLLNQLRKATGSVKILAIDTGRLPHDVRMSFVVNEFPQLIEQAVKELPDDRIFVYLSHWLFESTAGHLHQTPSPFAHAFAEGLGGPADLDQNRQISLDELHRFVWNRTRQSLEGDPEYQQTPVLLRGGQGMVDLAAESGASRKDDRRASLDELIVVSRLPGVSAEEEEEEEVPEEDPPAESEQAIQPTHRRSQFANAARRGLGLRPGVGGLALWQQTTPADADPPDAGEETAESKTASPATDTAPTEPAPTEPAPTEPASGKKAAIGPASTGQSTPSDPPPAASAASDPDESSTFSSLPQLVEQTWNARQAVVNWKDGRWTPLDFAPHLMRRIDFDLLRFEQRWLYDTNSTARQQEAEQITTDLQALSLYLDDPLGRPVPTFRSQLGNELRVVSQQATQFAELVARPPSARLAAESVDTVDRVERLHNFAAYQLQPLLQWQSSARLGKDQGTPHYQRTERLIAEFSRQVSELRQRLSTLAAKGSSVSTLEEKSLLRTMAEVETAWNNIDVQLADDLQKALAATGSGGEIRNALLRQTTLPAPAQRAALLTRLISSTPADESDVVIATPALPPSVANTQWDRVSTWLELHEQFIVWFDPDFDGKLPRSTRGDRWKGFAEAGDVLGSFYEDIPPRFRPSKVGELDAQQRRGLLCLLDPRDAGRIPTTLQLERTFQIQPRIPEPELRFVEDSRPYSLSTEGVDLRIPFVGAEIFDPIQLTVDFSDQYVDASYRGTALRSGEPIVLQAQDVEARQIPLTVAAKADSTQLNGNMPPLAVRLTTKGVPTVRRALRYELPLPNQIDLIVQRLGSSRSVGTDVDEVLTLRSFPNPPAAEAPRVSEFRFRLKNYSGVAKTMQIQLIKVPEVERRAWAVGRLGARGVDPKTVAAVFENGDPNASLRAEIANGAVVATAEVALPPSLREVAVNFGPPAPAGDAAAGTAATPPPDPAGTDISNGLLFLITNKDRPAERFAKWIEVTPLHPRIYVAASASYEDNSIIVRVTPRRDIDDDGNEDRIPWNDELPGDITGVIDGRNMGSTISLGEPVPITQGGVPSDGARRYVWLHVDGYPRAFGFLVQCRPGGQVRDFSDGKLQWAQIQQLTALFAANQRAQGEPLELTKTVKRANERLVMPQCRAVRAKLAVDVPTNTFVGDYAPGDAIRLEVDGQPKGAALYSDRDVTTSLVAVSGGLQLVATVADHELTIGVPSYDKDLIVKAVLPSNCTDVEEQPTTLFLDGRKPEVRKQASSVPRELRIGSTAKVELLLFDEGGLDLVEYGFDTAAPPGLDEGDAPAFDSIRGIEVEQEITLAADMLKVGRDYQLYVRLRDQAGLQSTTSFPITILPALPEPEMNKTGSIAGRVVDFEGNPVAGIGWRLSLKGVVELERGEQKPAGSFSENGQFRFDGLKPGKFTVTVQSGRGAFAKGDLKEAEVKPGETAQVVLRATRDNLKKLKD